MLLALFTQSQPYNLGGLSHPIQQMEILGEQTKMFPVVVQRPQGYLVISG